MIACGALVREIRAVLPSSAVTYLPAPLHNRPDTIVSAVAEVIDGLPASTSILLGYGDCGTGGALDRAIEEWSREGRSVERLSGDHCYEFFTGGAAFEQLHSEELGTFFLTDYLARHFDLLIWQGLGLADHPELLGMYFGHYTRVVYLSQTDDPARLDDLLLAARDAADQLGLAFEHRPTGLKPFGSAISSAFGAAAMQTNVVLSTKEAH